MAQVGYVERGRPASLRGRPWDSRLGGLPAFFGRALERPRCAHCREPLLLVLQIYSPTEVERALHVWGCNAAACNRARGRVSAGAWAVTRTQCAAAALGGGAGDGAPAPPAVAPTASDDWGAAGAWGGDDGAVEEAATHAEPAAAPTPPDDLVAALAAASLSSVEAETQPASDPELDRLRLPALDVATCAEPGGWRDGGGGTSDASEDDSDDERVALGAARDGAGGGVGGGGADDDAATAHARRLYADYQLSEADAAATRGGGGAAARDDEYGEGDGAGGGGGDDYDDDDGDDSDDGGSDGAAEEEEGGMGGGGHPKDFKREARRAPGDKRAGGARAQSRRLAGGGGGGGCEKYEPVPERLRYLLAFQQRSARVPRQVLRYAYGGEPLWPCRPWAAPLGAASRRGGGRDGAAPATAAANGATWPVPACGGCGSPRVFEMQLLPQALSLLRVDEHTTECLRGGGGASGGGGGSLDVGGASLAAEPAAASGSGGVPHAGPTAATPLDAVGGMDWATVLVFVCPLSCEASHEEVAVVVPSD